MAATALRYVVTQPFTISYEKNGKQTVDVVPGDVVLFDGFNFQVGDTTGISASLKVVVREGEWLVLDEGQEAPVLHERPVVTASRAYTATGGQQIEMSDPVEDRNLYQGRMQAPAKPDDLGTIVRQYEEQTEKNGTIITDDMADVRREVKVQNVDMVEVAKVSGQSKNAATSASGAVSLREETSTAKRPVVQGQRMAKQTAPTPAQRDYRHIQVDAGAQGVEVSRVSDRSDATMMKQASEGDKRPVVQHQTVAKATKPQAPKRVDVGSSTKAAVVQMQEATVVAKVREDANSVASKDGIRSTLTVRPNDEMSVGEATSTSAEGGVELADNGDLDVSDLLQDA